MMSFEDYVQQVRSDAIQCIENGEYDYCQDIDEVMDGLWIDDGVTGNGSGSYTFDAHQARENVAGLIGDEDFAAELGDLGTTAGEVFGKDPESIDVTARCLALGHVSADIEEAWDARGGEAA